jgi:hypothetical protein
MEENFGLASTAVKDNIKIIYRGFSQVSIPGQCNFRKM